jgi:type II secretory pathway pseudopilin PulG
MFREAINTQKIAFTLAEVLITLLIIGIVASLVIPAIINDTQNQEFYTLLKKDYSMLSDTAKMIMIENGGTLAGLFHNHNEMLSIFGNYLIYTKKCYENAEGCFYSGTNTWNNLNGNDGSFDHTNFSTAILQNGGTIMFRFRRSDCEYNYGSGSPAEHSCGFLHIDVNGFKGPNILGRDLFAFWVTKIGIHPFGMYNDIFSNLNQFCSKDYVIEDSGRGCAAKVLKGESIP